MMYFNGTSYLLLNATHSFGILGVLCNCLRRSEHNKLLRRFGVVNILLQHHIQVSSRVWEFQH